MTLGEMTDADKIVNPHFCSNPTNMQARLRINLKSGIKSWITFGWG